MGSNGVQESPAKRARPAGAKKKRKPFYQTMTIFDGWPTLSGNIFCGVNSGNINPPGAAGDKSRVFGNPDFGQKSRFENKLAVFHKVLKVCGLLFQCCGINFSMRFQAW